jgi:hypothetical protein
MQRFKNAPGPSDSAWAANIPAAADDASHPINPFSTTVTEPSFLISNERAMESPITPPPMIKKSGVMKNFPVGGIDLIGYVDVKANTVWKTMQ